MGLRVGACSFKIGSSATAAGGLGKQTSVTTITRSRSSTCFIAFRTVSVFCMGVCVSVPVVDGEATTLLLAWKGLCIKKTRIIIALILRRIGRWRVLAAYLGDRCGDGRLLAETANGRDFKHAPTPSSVIHLRVYWAAYRIDCSRPNICAVQPTCPVPRATVWGLLRLHIQIEPFAKLPRASDGRSAWSDMR